MFSTVRAHIDHRHVEAIWKTKSVNKGCDTKENMPILTNEVCDTMWIKFGELELFITGELRHLPRMHLATNNETALGHLKRGHIPVKGCRVIISGKITNFVLNMVAQSSTFCVFHGRGTTYQHGKFGGFGWGTLRGAALSVHLWGIVAWIWPYE